MNKPIKNSTKIIFIAIAIILVLVMLTTTMRLSTAQTDEKYQVEKEDKKSETANYDAENSFQIKDPVLQEKVKALKIEPGLIEDMNKLFAEKGYDKYIKESSEKYGVEEALIKAVITQESAGKEKAESKVGAQGLMQLMPETAKGLGVTNSFDPEQNIDGGTKYIKENIVRLKKVEYAIAAYNAGPGAVEKYNGIPPFPETQDYVVRVLRYYLEFGGSGSISSSKNTPSGNIKYSIKHAIRTGLKYDFSDYSRANEIAQAKKKQVIECLKAGSGTAGDDDVKECSSLASDSETHVSGIDKKGEFVIIFEKALNFPRRYTESKNKRIKFGYLIKDDIPPPATSIIQVLSADENKNSILSPIWSPNLASDTAKLELYCSPDGGASWKTVNPGASPKLLNLNNVQECSPIVAGKIYCFKAIAVDEAGNKQDLKSAVKCETAK